MKNKGLTKDAIIALIESLAMSQGFYGRLLNALNENPEQGEEWLEQVEKMNFRSDIDFIMYLEG
jgi:hypothetical protein